MLNQIGVPVATPPWKTVGKKIESRMRKALLEFRMVPEDGKVAVALSGGKDSLALLFMLKAVSGRGFPPLDLHAIHIGGEFTCGAGVQVNYLKRICEELKVPLHVRQSSQKLETLECYSCSRERRKLLFETALENGVKHIAFGHHRDDNAQTILMNLLKKGEFCGNLPNLEMQRFGVTIIRPLIYIPERDIIEFAKQEGFLRISCQCPVGQNSMRKKVDQLLTQMEEFFPDARNNISMGGLVYGSEKARES